MRNWLATAFLCTVFGTACSGDETTSSGASGGAAASNGGANPGSGGALVTGGVGNASGGAALSGGVSNATGGSAHGGAASGSGGKANAGAGSGGGQSGGAASTGNGGKSSGGAASTGNGGKSSGGTANAGNAGAPTVGCSSTAAGYKLVWHDEFDGPAGSAVDPTKWTRDVGGTGWGNNELEYYTDGAANAALDGNGNLVITAKKEAMGGMNYTSARLKTQGLYTFTYGRVEAKMKIPAGQGIWPAFWMLGADITANQWPKCGEIDIMENIGKEPNIIHATIHGPGYSAENGPTEKYSLSAPVASGFHTFAIEWEESAIRWYVDDMLYSTKTKADIPSGSTWVYSHPFFLLLNVAVGGGWPGNPDSTTTFPQMMTVDYVRVCQK